MKNLWSKYKQYILYLFFGGVTSVVNFAVYTLCMRVLRFDVVPSNALAWVLAVLVAFVTNKLWVFESRKRDAKTLLREFLEFVAARLITLLIETGLLWLFVDRLHWNDLLMKIITSVIVVVLNYIFSKFIIFKEKHSKKEGAKP